MADSPSPTPSPTAAPSVLTTDAPVQYWCHHCEKRVSVETVPNLPDIICLECENGFVESIAATEPPTDLVHHSRASSSDFVDEPSFGLQFLQVLRLIAQASREEGAPPSPPADVNTAGDDFLRIELDGWDNDDENEDDDDDDDGTVVEAEDQSDEENEMNGDNDEESDEEDRRRRRRNVVRVRIRDMAARVMSRRNRILDWGNNSMGLRLEMAELGGYVGNPEDYVDAAGYEQLLQNLAENDQNGRRGAPPAAKSAIAALDTVVIQSENDCLVCSVCKDGVDVGDTVTKLPCGHGYHEDCIVPWLGSRNSCPICRFELPTDDPDYEEEKKNKSKANAASTSG